MGTEEVETAMLTMTIIPLHYERRSINLKIRNNFTNK